MHILRLYSVIILGFLMAISASAESTFSLSCNKFFSNSPINTIPGVFEKLKLAQVPSQMGQIKALVKTLLAENAANMGRGHGIPKSELFKDIEISSIRPIDRLSDEKSDGYLSFEVHLLKNGYALSEALHIRTNGRVAFISSTYKFRTAERGREMAKHYKAAYHSDTGIKTIDQGEVLLAAMPKNFHLSRTMSETERGRWIKDEPFWSNYGQKVHFAPQYYKFGGSKTPFQVSVSRQQILDAYHRGEVEINVYDDHSVERNPMWMGKVKLEFEIVFVGLDGVERLRPILRDSLRQDIFPF